MALYFQTVTELCIWAKEKLPMSKAVSQTSPEFYIVSNLLSVLVDWKSALIKNNRYNRALMFTEINKDLSNVF